MTYEEGIKAGLERAAEILEARENMYDSEDDEFVGWVACTLSSAAAIRAEKDKT